MNNFGEAETEATMSSFDHYLDFIDQDHPVMVESLQFLQGDFDAWRSEMLEGHSFDCDLPLEMPSECPINTPGLHGDPLEGSHEKDRAKPRLKEVLKKHRHRITQLYHEENRTLGEVMRYMDEKENVKASKRTYKNYLEAWGIFKNNREKDVAQVVRQKQARDRVGKSSVIIRSGKIVDSQRIENYMRRKNIDPEDMCKRQVDVDEDNIINHVSVRTPSPAPSFRFPLPPRLPDHKEKIIQWISRSSIKWPGHIPVEIIKTKFPSRINPWGFLDREVGRSMFYTWTHVARGLRRFNQGRYSIGGDEIRKGFILAEDLLREKLESHSGLSRNAPLCILSLCDLLFVEGGEKVLGIFLAHVNAMARVFLREGHPLREFVEMLLAIHASSTYTQFGKTIQSSVEDCVRHTDRLIFSTEGRIKSCEPYLYLLRYRNSKQERGLDMQLVSDRGCLGDIVWPHFEDSMLIQRKMLI